MSRFNELTRIENAIKHKDQRELLWASDYCKTRINLATDLGLNATRIKAHIKHWQKTLDEVEEALNKK